MRIKKLFSSNAFPYHMVIETINGEYKKFYTLPARKIEEKDLTSLPCWNPSGRNGEEAKEYIYKMYGFEKIK